MMMGRRSHRGDFVVVVVRVADTAIVYEHHHCCCSGYLPLRADTLKSEKIVLSEYRYDGLSDCMHTAFLATDPNRAETQKITLTFRIFVVKLISLSFDEGSIDLYTYIHLYNIYKKQQ